MLRSLIVGGALTGVKSWSRPSPARTRISALKATDVGFSAEFEARAASSYEEVRAQYEASVASPSKFWAAEARTLHWETPFDEDKVYKGNFKRSEGPIFAEWFGGGETNVCFNALDRHVANGLGDRACFIAERNDEGETSELQPASYTYAETLAEVKRVARALRARGVGEGDRVVIFMPMVPELPIAMLACARIGAVHTVVFGGFSAESLASRIVDAEASAVIAADGVRRGGKVVDLWQIAETALQIARGKGVGVGAGSLVLRRLDDATMPAPSLGADGAWWHEACASPAALAASDAVQWVHAEHPLFILYTSGSTGTPKGIVHTTGGYMVGAGYSFRNVFDAPSGDADVWFCTADCGWITGHSYVAYGPLLNGATQLIFEGVPSWPDAGRLWRVVDEHKVTHLYTAPTAIRALMRAGDAPVTRASRSSLRVLGSVGEPINPEAWRWYHDVAGDKRCPIADTWWQTETGVVMIAPLLASGAPALKPGAAMSPCAGVVPALLDGTTGLEIAHDAGQETSGLLVLTQPWPSMARTCWRNHQRFEETYFSFDGYYLTGDGDADGHFWITGRVDDVVVVSGHNIGTAEVEAALAAHPAVAEAAIVGVPHPLKGFALYAFVTLTDEAEAQCLLAEECGVDEDAAPVGAIDRAKLAAQLKLSARANVAAFAAPDTIHWAPALPKTRSGKIMRRVLRKIAEKGVNVAREELGDVSTLADPKVVDDLIATHASA